MSNEELTESLRTEINTYLKNTVADLQQEIVVMQERISAEIERHRQDLLANFEGLLAKGAAAQIDEQFEQIVSDHVEIAYKDGVKEGREAAEAIAAQQAAEVAEAHAIALAAAQETAVNNSFEPEPAVETVSSATNFALIRDAINEISQQSSQAEILKALVKHSSQYAPRGAFFIVKSDHLVGWRTFGNELEGNIDAVREVVLPMSNDTLLASSIRQNVTERSTEGGRDDDQQYLEKLNFENPQEMVAIPLVVRGRGVAVLYADSGADNAQIQVEALEALVQTSSLAVELLAASKSSAPAAQATRRESQPTINGATTDSYNGATATQTVPAYTAPATTSVETVIATASRNDYEVLIKQPQTEDSPVNFGQSETASTFEAETNSSAQSFSFSEQPKIEPASESKAITQFDSFGAAPQPVETVSAFDTVAPMTNEFSTFASPQTQSDTQSVTVPIAAAASGSSATRRFSERNLELPIDVPEEERRLHNDARRFARLLVSEIKLYNEQKVKEGRQVGDLYSRLREAVDRSREMYNKRVAPPVAAKFDYFNYELVGTLAEGDENKLGNDYPGATV